MPTTTTNYSLWLYNSTTDQSENFADWRGDMAGITTGANMYKIDSALKVNADAITALEGKKSIIVVEAVVTSQPNYISSVSGYTAYTTGDFINLSVDTDTTGTAQLNINSIAVKSLMKVDSTGAFVNLTDGDLLENRSYLFKYDGTRWLWVSAVSADQVNISGTSGNLVAVSSIGGIEEQSASTSRTHLNVEDGAEVNPDLMTETEAKAGAAVTKRVINAAVMKAAVVEHAPSGGLTYVAKTVTTANLTLVEDESHLTDISGMTADRDIVLPTPSALGKECEIILTTDAPASYEAVVKINSVELTRLFIGGEKMKFVSTGTNAADWIVADDGRIPSYASQRCSSAQTGLATATNYKIALGTALLDRGEINDTANSSIVLRRAGAYHIMARSMWQANSNASPSNYAKIYISGTFASGYLAANSANELLEIDNNQTYTLSAGDYLEAYAIQNSGIDRDLYFSLSNGLWSQLSVEEVL